MLARSVPPCGLGFELGAQADALLDQQAKVAAAATVAGNAHANGEPATVGSVGRRVVWDGT
jgi:hypothetical protein